MEWPKWPQYGAEEAEAVNRVLASQQLFAAHEVRTFEEQFADYLDCKRAVGVGNATEGLHLALASLEVGRGDEVIVTSSSFISTASCILMQNAVPIFVDIEPESLAIDPDLIEDAITPRTKAIIVTHILGYPARIREIMRVADARNIPVIEDASHAPGARVEGRMCGTFGAIGVFSLQQRKAISTGDGGVICTDIERIAEDIRRLRSFGHERLSYNYRMTEFSAALAQVGLKKLDRQNEERQGAAHYLKKAYSDDEWVRVRLSRPGEVGVYYAIALEVAMTDAESTKFLTTLTNMGVPMRSAFPPLNRHPHFVTRAEPARGYPWRDPTYDGLMTGKEYEDLDLPMTYEYCYGRILEVYAHPSISHMQLHAFVETSREVYLKVASGEPRAAW